MTKKLIDVDDRVLNAARVQLGTLTIKDTVDQALRRVAEERAEKLSRGLDLLAEADLDDRARAWR